MGLTNTSNHIGNQSTNERWRFKLVLVERKLPQLPNNVVAGKSAVKTAHTPKGRKRLAKNCTTNEQQLKSKHAIK